MVMYRLSGGALGAYATAYLALPYARIQHQARSLISALLLIVLIESKSRLPHHEFKLNFDANDC